MICAVVLAAGRSRRMGTQKLLLPLEGKPVIARIVDELMQATRMAANKPTPGPSSAFACRSGATAPKRSEGGREGNFEVRVTASSPPGRGQGWVRPETKPHPPSSDRAEGSAITEALLHQIIIVVGRDGTQIQQALRDHAVSFVENPDPTGDMLSSVRCGLRVLPEACEAILVALGDQPGITHELVTGLIRAFHQTGSGIIVPAHGGRRGHPVLFAARFRDEMLARHDGVGLHGLLDSHPDELFEMAVSTASVLEDLDTPEDYQRHQKSTAV